MTVFADDEEHPDSDEAETTPCPYCNRAIHKDSVGCPHCENYLSEEDAPGKTPVWIIVGTILALLVALLWAFGG